MKLVIKYGPKGKEYHVDGKRVTEKQVNKLFPNKFQQLVDSHKAADGHRPACWPMTCVLTGVDPSEIPEAKAAAAKAGLRIDFDPETGGAIFESRGQRRDYLRHMGQFDKDGTYGDY